MVLLMNLTKGRFGGLFLLLSVIYGYFSVDIPLLPEDKFEVFHAQTLPYWLSGLGIIFSVLLIVLKPVASSASEPLSKSNVLLMFGLMAFTFVLSVALAGFPYHYKYFFSLKLLDFRRTQAQDVGFLAIINPSVGCLYCSSAIIFW